MTYKGPRTMCSNGCIRELAGRIGHSYGERLLMRPTGDADAPVVLCMSFLSAEHNGFVSGGRDDI